MKYLLLLLAPVTTALLLGMLNISVQIENKLGFKQKEILKPLYLPNIVLQSSQ